MAFQSLRYLCASLHDGPVTRIEFEDTPGIRVQRQFLCEWNGARSIFGAPKDQAGSAHFDKVWLPLLSNFKS